MPNPRLQYHCAMPDTDASAHPDYDAIGRSLVALCATQHALGHANASGTVRDYVPRPEDAAFRAVSSSLPSCPLPSSLCWPSWGSVPLRRPTTR